MQRKANKTELFKIHIYSKIGLETLTIIRMIAFHIDKKKAHSKKGLFSILDLVGDYHDSKIKDYVRIIKLKQDLFGKDELREICEFTIKLYENMGVNVFEALGVKSKQMMLEMKEQIKA